MIFISGFIGGLVFGVIVGIVLWNDRRQQMGKNDISRRYEKVQVPSGIEYSINIRTYDYGLYKTIRNYAESEIQKREDNDIIIEFNFNNSEDEI